MEDAQLYRLGGDVGDGFDFERAERVALGIQLRLPLVAPLDDEASRGIGCDNLARVGDPAVREDELPRRAGLPVTLAMHAEPVVPRELRRRQRGPQALGCSADEGD